MTVSRQMPYLAVKVGSAEGDFVLDFGTNSSYIDPARFRNGTPRPVSGSTNEYADFDYWGVWSSSVMLKQQDYSGVIGTVRQAGLIGTDILAWGIYTLDYLEGSVYRANNGSFCSDADLRMRGFVAAPTTGYYSNPYGTGPNDPPNIPAVPIRIGAVRAVGQLDTGFDDTEFPHSVNINRPLFDALHAAGVQLRPLGHAVPPLKTCVAGVFDSRTAFALPADTRFEIMSVEGAAIVSAKDAVIFLKESPAAAQSCLGITALSYPAAQVGASFYVEAKRLVFDPFTSRVWFGTR